MPTPTPAAVAVLHHPEISSGLEFYVDIRRQWDEDQGHMKLSLTPESVGVIKGLHDLRITHNIQAASGWFGFATFDSKTELLLTGKPTLSVTERGFVVRAEAKYGGFETHCHFIDFHDLGTALSKGRKSLDVHGCYSRMGGALLFSGWGGGACFRELVIKAVPELAAAEMSLVMAERIASEDLTAFPKDGSLMAERIEVSASTVGNPGPAVARRQARV